MGGVKALTPEQRRSQMHGETLARRARQFATRGGRLGTPTRRAQPTGGGGGFAARTTGGLGGGGGGWGGDWTGATVPEPRQPGPGGPWGGGTTSPRPPLELTADPSPELQEATRRWEQHMANLQQQAQDVDQNLQYQIDQYKSRLGEGPTTRAIERSASAIRDQMAGLTAQAEREAQATGRGPGYGQAGIAEAAQRAQAGAAADIALGRERDLDRLTIAGQGIMQAPGQRQLAYNQLASQFYGLAPYQAAAGHGLAEKGLGLQAYLGQGDLGLRELEAQARMYGTPMDWFRMMF